jgi:hypothetical protein
LNELKSLNENENIINTIRELVRKVNNMEELYEELIGQINEIKLVIKPYLNIDLYKNTSDNIFPPPFELIEILKLWVDDKIKEGSLETFKIEGILRLEFNLIYYQLYENRKTKHSYSDIFDTNFQNFVKDILKSNCIRTYYIKYYPECENYLANEVILNNFLDSICFVPLAEGRQGITLSSLYVYINSNSIEKLNHLDEEQFKAVK